MPKNAQRCGAFGATEADREVSEAWIMGSATGGRDASQSTVREFVTRAFFTRCIGFGEFRPA